jgi:alkyl hydroperoxide reductase subunit AhpC
MLVPRQKTPPLALDTVAHGRFDLDSITAERGVVLCFYRGLHCPLCAKYLVELEKQTPAFAERGVETLALSTDGEERVRGMAEKVGAKALRFAYGLPLREARDWGLYISTGRGKTSVGIEEPERFAEPGVFMVQPGRTLYWASVQSMPFVRPNFAEMVQALDFIIEKSYPARGEYTGAL